MGEVEGVWGLSGLRGVVRAATGDGVLAVLISGVTITGVGALGSRPRARSPGVLLVAVVGN